MPAEHVNREAVTRRIDRLEAEYGIEYHEEADLEADPERFPELRRSSRAGYIGSAYAWVVRPPEAAPGLSDSMPDSTPPEPDRVLMVVGRGRDDAWGIPGGGREADERLEETVRREVREETGVECAIADAFGVRHERRTAPGHDETLHVLRAVFEATYDGGHIAVQPGELNGAAWLATRPATVHPLAAPKADRWFDGGA